MKGRCYRQIHLQRPSLFNRSSAFGTAQHHRSILFLGWNEPESRSGLLMDVAATYHRFNWSLPTADRRVCVRHLSPNIMGAT